jgi:hypothetical protein
MRAQRVPAEKPQKLRLNAIGGVFEEPRIISFLGLLNCSVFLWLELVLQAGDDNL